MVLFYTVRTPFDNSSSTDSISITGESTPEESTPEISGGDEPAEEVAEEPKEGANPDADDEQMRNESESSDSSSEEEKE